MRTQTVFVIFVFTALAGMVTSQGYGEVYCGRRLATVLALLCDNNLIKRTPSQYTSAQNIDSSWPWIEAHRAHSMGRKKRQVVAECCDKPCTVDELLSYCGN
ncbi:bombyxin A-1 homolog [Vanessa atalanta]|uniref:bombyxin A-1 homolog n=1 Tax=Vanessa atalanta TaxID=42275 RepID=UPI001FCDA8ED|nr:bombyxin A-1 homolog [Vanessa atalanta]